MFHHKPNSRIKKVSHCFLHNKHHFGHWTPTYFTFYHECPLTMLLNAVPQSNMEWKPKSSQKSSLISPSNIGTAATPISPSANNSTISNEVTHLPEKLSHVNISEDQHVIIPQHLRVPEAERSQLTFGSFEQGLGSMKGVMAGFHPVDSVEERKDEPAVRFVPFLHVTFLVFVPISVSMLVLCAKLKC